MPSLQAQGAVGELGLGHEDKAVAGRIQPGRAVITDELPGKLERRFEHAISALPHQPIIQRGLSRVGVQRQSTGRRKDRHIVGVIKRSTGRGLDPTGFVGEKERADQQEET